MEGFDHDNIDPIFNGNILETEFSSTLAAAAMRAEPFTAQSRQDTKAPWRRTDNIKSVRRCLEKKKKRKHI